MECDKGHAVCPIYIENTILCGFFCVCQMDAQATMNISMDIRRTFLLTMTINGNVFIVIDTYIV